MRITNTTMRLKSLKPIGLMAVCLAVMGTSDATKLPVISPATGNAVAALSPEVRLRKLHLVRPDLIPYPLAYEMYC